jgi:hypothetical protein
MSRYSDLIIDATKQTDPDVLQLIEDVMRHDIFHSTLDWQTREQLEHAAREAVLILRELGDIP